MTSKQKQIRAVALAALMVLSVFAGTIAFTGTAAAAATSVSATNAPVGADSGLNVQASDGDATADDIVIWIDTNGDGTKQSGEASITVTDDNGGTEGAGSDSFDAANVPDESGTYTLYAYESGSTNTKEATGSFDVDADAPSFDSAIEAGGTIEVSFDADETLYQEDGSTALSASEVEVFVDGESKDIDATTFSQSTGRITFDLVMGDVSANSDVEVNFTTPVADVQGNSITVENESVTVTSGVISETSGQPDGTKDGNAYQGELVAYNASGVTANENEGVSVETKSGKFIFDGYTGANSVYYLFNTSERNATATYQFESAEGGFDLGLRDLGLSVKASSLNVTKGDAIKGTVSTNAGGRTIEAKLYNSKDTQVGSTQELTTGSNSGEATFNFDTSGLSTGTYTVEVTDVDSGVTKTTSKYNLKAKGNSDASFTQKIVTEQRGDVANITVQLENTDTATVQIGSPDVGYRLNATVSDGDDDDNQVTLQFNTYAASAGGDVVTVVGDEDSLDNVDPDEQNTVNALLDAGEYDLSVDPGNEYNDAESTDLGTLVLEERSTDSINTWTAPSGLSANDLDKSGLYEAAANNNVTLDSKIANGDYAIHQINASGLEGYLANQGNDETAAFVALLESDLASLKVNQTEANVNRQPWTVNYSDDVTVVSDAENDTYFVMFDTSDVIREESGKSLQNGDGLTATFKLNKSADNALVSNNESVSVDYEIVEGTVSVDEPVNVSNAASQTVEGETTLAPGTQLSLRVRSSGDTQPSFLKTSSVYVTENNTFSATFDFSGQNTGDTFDFIVRSVAGTSFDEQESFEGNVVEGSQTTETVTDNGTVTTQGPTETATTGTPATTTAATTDAGTTEQPATDEPTDTSTPGFGVVVAVIALLAAALLAVRRD
ncbi:BGTF surface domain-containing protein [Halopelagius fulvigenes]|uniref:BGTF surface domain-containing protein n=1 Tax=Halopelagius fulvigenes TaxID=1198324 RepID=A0ABD5U3T9_9EURY